MENLNKYLSVERVEMFPLPPAEKSLKEFYDELGDKKYLMYIVPRTKEEWEAQEKEYKDNRSLIGKISDSITLGKSQRLPWEESKAIWDKVNSTIHKFNNLSDKDKEIPAIDNIVIEKNDAINVAYITNHAESASIYISTGFLEKYPIYSKAFQETINHEIGHHYDVVNNGLKIIKYDIKQHLQDSNPELLKWLLEKKVTDKDFEEASTYKFPKSALHNILGKKEYLSSKDHLEFINLYNKGNKEGDGEDNKFIIEHSSIIKSMENFAGIIQTQFEYSADKYATILDCKTDQLSTDIQKHMINEFASVTDLTFITRPPEQQDIADLEHSKTHPNIIARTMEMQKIIDICHDTPTEDLMKLKAPIYPKTPNTNHEQTR